MKKMVALLILILFGVFWNAFAFPPTPPPTGGSGDMSKSTYDADADGVIAVPQGGTGAATLTDGGILLGSGAGAITALGVATNGQIPIGDGTTDPVLANITETGDALIVTNGAGTIALSAHANVEALADGAMDPDNISGDTVDDNLIDPAIGGAGANTSAMTGLPYMTSGVVSAWPVNSSTARIQTTTSGHSWSIDIYDNDGAAWMPGWTFTNGNTPTISLGAGVTLDGIGTVDLTAYSDYKVGGVAAFVNEKLATFAWDGGGAAVTTGATSKRCISIPHVATITGYTMMIDQDPGAAGTILNLDKDSWSDTTLPTTDMDGAAHANPPTVPDNKIAAKDVTLTGWTVAVAANDNICATVATNAVATWINITIYGSR